MPIHERDDGNQLDTWGNPFDTFYMHFDILTLFPEVFPPYLNVSMLQKAQGAGLLRVVVHNIRDHASGRHRITDEPPYGGGGGMVLKPEPIFAAVEALINSGGEDNHPSTFVCLHYNGKVITKQAGKYSPNYRSGQ